ncbi:tripartite tricarboxylate transporter substrate binding protein [Diaphorobacter sp. LR2014-1]|uniref:Bug family tripartite tricarboxylate transporter substrate binding protein n=1 Tax=Diaphorobacter sp. LR2014-1 TaxID=1933219 RepID=UPI000CDA0592|nr:tripartite tricarboxylate transporter substrate binding protein [Diaphorobacter sp. LR2014-1]POR07746.1 ABC transporter substrate-binding protein [Diaphorobacter sp. LR2014-1]
MNTLRTLAAVALLAAAASAHSQTWPAKPVRIVVPYPPGGAVDVVTRKMAARLQEQTGQTFFVENKAGATGTIGIASVVQSAPDGYTLVANDTTYALLPHIFRKLPFDHDKDLLPVGAFVFAPMALAVRNDSAWKSLDDLLKAARAEPGKLNYGTGGAGTMPHFASEALGIATGARFMHIPFKGAGEATQALLSGTIDFQIASTPGIIGQVKGGTARLLAISGERRLPALPQVPTFAEAGLKGYGVVNFTGLWAPKGTPADVTARLQQEIATAMASADMRAYSESIGAEPGLWDAAAFARNLRERTAYWGKVAANTAFEKQ